MMRAWGLALLMTAVGMVALAMAPDEPVMPSGNGVDLSHRFGDLVVERTAEGYRITVQTDRGELTVSPEQFARLVFDTKQEQERRGFLFVLFNISSWTGVAWVGLGLLGQLLFTGRMLVQWLSSERARRSVVPVSFWWMSLIGASMLILYFLWRKDIVGVLGQGTGWFIYIRNLWMIHRHRPQPITSDPAPEPELGET